MKVGTDGVLLGAWACVEGRTVLDIGTGTGLIALMAAQRNPDAQVLGIEIDKRKLVLNEQIKTYGSYTVEARLFTDITGKINLIVYRK